MEVEPKKYAQVQPKSDTRAKKIAPKKAEVAKPAVKKADKYSCGCEFVAVDDTRNKPKCKVHGKA